MSKAKEVPKELALLSNLKGENNKLLKALNKIAMLASSELAYTKEFTEKAQSIAHEALGLRTGSQDES